MLRFFLTTFLLNALFWTSGVVLEYCMRIAGRHRIHRSRLLFLSPIALLGRGMCSLRSEMNTLVTSLESVIFLFFSFLNLSCVPSFLWVLHHRPSLSIRSVCVCVQYVCVCVREGFFFFGLLLFYRRVVLVMLSLWYQGCSCSVWCLAH